MNKKPKLNAKIFPFAARQPLFEMAKKYKRQKYVLITVWTYMHWRSGKGGLFELAEDIVCLDTGIDVGALRWARRTLVAEGWLRKEELRRRNGTKEVRRWIVIAPVPQKVQPSVDKQPTEGSTIGGSTTDGGTTDGSTGHTVVLQTSTPSASTDNRVPSEPQNQGSVLVETVASEGANEQEPSAVSSSAPLFPKQSNPLPQTVQEFWDDDLVAWEAKVLLHTLKPNLTDSLVNEQLPMALEILYLVPEHQDARDLVEWNHKHRGHKYASKQDRALYIRSCKQLLAALKSPDANLVNDYDTHAWDECSICKEHGLMHTKELRAAIAAKKASEAEQERQRLARLAEQERQIAEEEIRRERWSQYVFERPWTPEEAKAFQSNRQFPYQQVADKFAGKAPEAVLRAMVIWFAAKAQPFSWGEFETTFTDAWDARKAQQVEKAKAAVPDFGGL